MEGVGSWLAVIQMRWRDPFGVAVRAFSGGPVFVNESVVGSASEGELVDIGGVGGCPIFDVVDFAEVPGYVAAGRRTPTVFGVEHYSLRW